MSAPLGAAHHRLGGERPLAQLGVDFAELRSCSHRARKKLSTMLRGHSCLVSTCSRSPVSSCWLALAPTDNFSHRLVHRLRHRLWRVLRKRHADRAQHRRADRAPKRRGSAPCRCLAARSSRGHRATPRLRPLRRQGRGQQRRLPLHARWAARARRRVDPGGAGRVRRAAWSARPARASRPWCGCCSVSTSRSKAPSDMTSRTSGISTWSWSAAVIGGRAGERPAVPGHACSRTSGTFTRGHHGRRLGGRAAGWHRSRYPGALPTGQAHTVASPRPLAAFSGGQVQRLIIARALRRQAAHSHLRRGDEPRSTTSRRRSSRKALSRLAVTRIGHRAPAPARCARPTASVAGSARAGSRRTASEAIDEDPGRIRRILTQTAHLERLRVRFSTSPAA